MSNGNGHHWSKFCWRDWSADKALHPCSLGAKGFWIEMLCIMHEGTPVGHLTLGGKPASIRQMAANAYCSEKEVRKYLAELEEAGVFSRTNDGTIYSRRMVKDAAASDAGREHIAKRWNTTTGKDTPNRVPNTPPNRVPNTPPNREATRKPNGGPNSHPTRDPITKSQRSDSDLEAEEEKGSFKKEPFLSNDVVGSRGRAETPQDNLVALFAEAEIEQPKPGNADPELVKTHVRRVAKACEMRVPYGSVRAPTEQIIAAESQQPPVVEDVGYRWAPAEPMRTVEQQLAELERMMRAEAAQAIAAK